jgi:hypothetical protein
MFQWYKAAAHCYVYLSDLRPGTPAEDGLGACRWFTRGWTLQELIAPNEVQFYDREWKYIGSKADFSETIASITRINVKVLLGYDKAKRYSVASRMAWAAHRQTERTEDLAYCLLGIFDVNMPLIYGEGAKAFRRLQEEIIKSSNDLTIFAWDGEKALSNLCGLFARSPAGFVKSHSIDPYERLWSNPVFTVTNKGLRFDNFMRLWRICTKNQGSEHVPTIYSITLGMRRNIGGRTDFRMQLRKVGPRLFIRDGNLIEEPWPSNDSRTTAPTDQFFILTEMPGSYALNHRNRYRSVHFSRNDKIEIRNVIPESHWDDTSQIFFAPLESYSLVLATACLVTLGTSNAQVIVCIDFSTDDPFCRIFDAEKHAQYTSWLFRYGRWGIDVTWTDIKAENPGILDFSNQIEVYAEGIRIIISVSLRIGVVESISQEAIYSLNFRFDKANEVQPLLLPP